MVNFRAVKNLSGSCNEAKEYLGPKLTNGTFNDAKRFMKSHPKSDQSHRSQRDGIHRPKITDVQLDRIAQFLRNEGLVYNKSGQKANFTNVSFITLFIM